MKRFKSKNRDHANLKAYFDGDMLVIENISDKSSILLDAWINENKKYLEKARYVPIALLAHDLKKQNETV